MTGSAIGLLSLLFGWLTLKPNRLAAGDSLRLWEAAGWAETALVAILWLACLALSLLGGRTQGLLQCHSERSEESPTLVARFFASLRMTCLEDEKRAAVGLGVVGSAVLLAEFFLAGGAANTILAESTPFARVSPSAGFWIALAGSYIVLFAARERLRDVPIQRRLLTWGAPLAVAVLLVLGWLDGISIVQEFHVQQGRFAKELARHVALFGGSTAAGTLLGVPLGVWAARSLHVERPILYFANIAQTVPSLAFFGFLIAPLSALSLAFPFLREAGIRGVGAAPAFIALVVYSLLPIVRNTHVSLRQVDPAVVDAGMRMGMTRTQVFRRLEAPLAAPLVLEGVRIAAVQGVGNTAVAALIGAGGLGHFIFTGLGQAAPDLIIVGALPIIGLALVVDTGMRAAVRLATPKGLAGQRI